MSQVKQAWNRIESWIKANMPGEFVLPPPASADAISALEESVGQKLPKEFRESYAIHDGSNGAWISREGYLMPVTAGLTTVGTSKKRLSDVMDSRDFMCVLLRDGHFDDPGFKSKPKGPIRRDWWHAGWLPVTYNECGDHLCIDLAPAKGGTKGQVIDWWHEQGATRVVAASFGEWLEQVATQLESGKCRFDPKTNALQWKKR